MKHTILGALLAMAAAFSAAAQIRADEKPVSIVLVHAPLSTGRAGRLSTIDLRATVMRFWSFRIRA